MQLPVYKAPDNLWEKIEKQLPQKTEVKKQPSIFPFIWKAAAILLIIFSTAFIMTVFKQNDNPNILSAFDFQRMEFLENQYLKEIEK